MRNICTFSQFCCKLKTALNSKLKQKPLVIFIHHNFGKHFVEQQFPYTAGHSNHLESAYKSQCPGQTPYQLNQNLGMGHRQQFFETSPMISMYNQV